ncbi:MAG: hypothetical protein ACM3SU_02570 [Acidobacteriota bacterium]
MRIKPFALAAIAFSGSCLLVGCKARESAAPLAGQTPSPPSSAEPTRPAAGEVVATPAELAAMPEASPSAAAARQTPTEGTRPAGKPSPLRQAQKSEAAPEPAREAPTQAPAPLGLAPAVPAQAASASRVTDPGGPIAVAATKAGLTRIGAEKCKLCHKVQFASWVETAHAKRTPPLDCESCHGPGSEYKSPTVMKDPEKAKAAGLVMPTKAFCATCHSRDWKDDMLRKAHAHKGQT